MGAELVLLVLRHQRLVHRERCARDPGLAHPERELGRPHGLVAQMHAADHPRAAFVAAMAGQQVAVVAPTGRHRALRVARTPLISTDGLVIGIVVVVDDLTETVGAQLELTLELEESDLTDPLTGESRSWGGHQDREIDVLLRHDIPGSKWAWGLGAEYNHTLPYYRLGETGLNDEGPTYTYGFIEHKDVFGMTANLTIFNLTDGRARQDRFVYEGYRDRTALLFRETQDLSVQPIFNFTLSGDF